MVTWDFYEETGILILPFLASSGQGQPLPALDPLGPVAPSFRALSGRLKFTVRRHKFNKDSLLWGPGQTHKPNPTPQT